MTPPRPQRDPVPPPAGRARRPFHQRLPRFLRDTEVPMIVWVVLRTIYWRLRERAPRRRPEHPARILVAHHLLLGDTILLAPLLAKLRARYPAAEIVLTMPLPMLPLYAARPYGVTVWPFGLRRVDTLAAMFGHDGFDLAIVPGDNRHSWLAAALRAKWIVAHAGDRPFYKNWPVDEALPYPDTPAGMGDIFAQLVEGPAPPPFRAGDWPAPSYAPFDRPSKPYAVLHVGASNPLRYWPAERWLALAAWLREQSLEVVWTGGPKEAAIVEAIDPERRYRSYAERLDLAQLWALIAGAEVFVSPDTGVAHLARLTGTRSVTLFGPGSVALFGRGAFWRETPCVEVVVEPFACRDQDQTFRRAMPWIWHCRRKFPECRESRCMQAIGTDHAQDAISRLRSA